MGLPAIHAVWVGNRLNDVAVCCLKSFLMRGHEVTLHAYDPIDNCPADVRIADAGRIVPRERIMRHARTGSYALFSDIFRYHLLGQVDGIYVDCDVYCLRPLMIPSAGYLFGFESRRTINGAILALPAESALLQSLLEIADDPGFVPPWFSLRRKLKIWLRRRAGAAYDIRHMPWGVLGPRAITYYAKKLGLSHLAQPIDVFYPVHYARVGQFYDARLGLEDVTTQKTLAIHLFNEMLSRRGQVSLPDGCLMQRMLVNEI